MRLIVDPEKLLKAVSKPSYQASEIINSDITLVKFAKSSILLNKPIYTGFTILDYAKLLMYEFYYDYLKVEYQNNFKLRYTDTDLSLIHI